MSEAYDHASFYSYDIHGNVDTLVQDYGIKTVRPNLMNKNGNRWKKIVYEYDLISGKVNMVQYQPGWEDRWIHRYSYDAENRLTLVETSNDSLVWEKDARYEYYRHGPLARTVLGEQLVQGIDYAYTLQGWLKGINSTKTIAAHDMGKDGLATGVNKYVARDALGLNLNYFNGDYKAINSGVTPFPQYVGLTTGGLPNDEYRPLYNGNISSAANTIRKLGEYTYLYNYRYDQLNRLTGQDAWVDGNMVTNNLNGSTAVISFRERVSYDPNGNILRYTRNNAGTYQSEMDNLRYFYYPGTNRLKHVTDTIPDTKYGSTIYEVVQDIDSQPDSNYVYDAIGNLVQNKKEKITSIKWNVYGKITEINRDAQTDEKRPTYWLRYQYDAAGNRIGKTEKWLNKAPTTPVMTLSFTWYVRDAQGNLISTYAANTTDMTALDTLQKLQVFFNDYQVYGSSRLGSYSNGFNVDNGPIDRTVYTNYATAFSRGWRQYELTNHLGNVLTTISDKKNGVSSGPVGSLIDYYEPELVNAQDYFPFGMVSRLNAGASQYRFGFNGKENDNEVKGYGGQQDYGMRIYDTRLGRFLSVDPLQKQFPDLTPYQFAGNTPLQAVDLDGLEPRGFMNLWEARTDPYMTKWGYTVQDFYDYQTKRVWTVMNVPNTNQQFYWETKYENAEQLFKPLNTSLNKDGQSQWTGLFRQFEPKLISQDKSFYYGLLGGMSIPFVALYAKPIAAYLVSELLEELVGVPIPDGPVDFWKYQMKKKAEREIAKEMAGEAFEREARSSVPRNTVGANRRLDYENASYHGKKDNAIKSRAPKNGQSALDVSVQVKETSPRRIGIDYETNEFVVFDKTINDTYHAHVRSWNDLHQDMQNALKEAGLVNKKGKIIQPSSNE